MKRRYFHRRFVYGFGVGPLGESCADRGAVVARDERHAGRAGQRAGEKFNESQDKYTVVAITKGNYDEVTNGIIAAYRAKRPPEMVQIDERGYITMLLSEAVVPVQDLLSSRATRSTGPTSSSRWRASGATRAGVGDAVQLVDADLLVQQGSFPEGGLRQAGGDLAGAGKAALRHQGQGHQRVRHRAARRFLLEPLENYSAINNQPYGTLANGYDGLGTEFVYNKTKVVSQVARMKKWLDDGMMQIAGQGFSPEQLFTSGRCSTFVNSTASHSNIERNAKINWSATFLPHESDINPPLNSTIGGGAIWVMKGHTPERYEAVAAFLDFLAQPETQVWWHGVTGYVPATNGPTRWRASGAITRSIRRARSRCCNCRAARPTRIRAASVSAISCRPCWRSERRWRRSSPARSRRSRRWTTRSSAATRSCGSSRS